MKHSQLDEQATEATEEKHDFVMFTLTAKGFDEKGSTITVSGFRELVQKFDTSRIEQDTSIVYAVFTDRKEVLRAVKELKDAELGIALTVTGLTGQDHAVGIGGKLSKLPENEILEITTMCGHGMVSQYLARQILIDMKRGIRTPQEAAEYLATPCICGVFNPKRAQRLLEELAEIWCFDEN